MMMSLMNGTMAIKNARPKKHKLRKNFCPLPGIHEDGGLGVLPRTRKMRQKNCGYEYRVFCLVAGHNFF